MADVIPLPIDVCPICGKRIGLKAVVIRDGSDLIHAADCWPVVAEMRMRTQAGQPVEEAADVVVDALPLGRAESRERVTRRVRFVHRRDDIYLRVFDGDGAA